MTTGLGERLKIERNRLNLSQPKVAEAVGVTKNTVIAWEKGTTSPTIVQLFGLSEMGFDVHYILTGQHATPSNLSPEEVALVENYRAATEENRYHLKAVSAALAQSSLRSVDTAKDKIS